MKINTSKIKRVLSAVLAFLVIMSLMSGGTFSCAAGAADESGDILRAGAADESGDILRAGFAEDSEEWIEAYKEFIENKEYLNMGQVYGSEVTITGKFYDMDHDGIPELIIENGFLSDSLKMGFIYSYVGDKIEYLGIGPSDGYYILEDREKSDLYGYYNESGYLTRYIKNGNEIITELYKDYSDGDFYYESGYGYVRKKTPSELVNLLAIYGGFSFSQEYMKECTFIISEWDTLFGNFDFCTGDSLYDPDDIDGTEPEIMRAILMHPSVAEIYDHGIDSSWGRDGKKDPEGRYESYFSIEEDWAEFVAKEIYNIKDDDYDRLLSELLAKDCYRSGGRIYSFMGGVGGPGFVNRYEEVHYDGEFFYVTYSTYLDNGYDAFDPESPNYYKASDSRTVRLKRKEYGGTVYWSIYSIEKGSYSDSKYAGNSLAKVDDKEKIEFSDRYAPYPVIALKSRSNGCYVTCDIGARKSDGQYEHFNEPELHMDAGKIEAYEMFELVPCTDGSYALRSLMNRKYLSKDRSGSIETGLGILVHSYVYKDWIEDNCKLDLNLKDKYTKLKFRYSNDWMSYASGFLEPNSDESKAEEFEIVYVNDKGYEDWEKGVLASEEWFNLDGKGKGYWDIQNDIGSGSVEALETLGYTPMHLRGDNKKTIENFNMQCSVGVKEENGFYEVIIAFQGTDGFSDETSDVVNHITDLAMSVLNGFNICPDGHDGYITMAGLFMAKEGDIVATVNGNEITYEQLLEKGEDYRARFTILGHSMGGAMAQIYAFHLLQSNIDVDLIRGRTFNSALALTEDDNGKFFTDWYNLCVSTDTVTNGQVPGSINTYGIHKIGRTIWLYDNEPDLNVGEMISEPKHNMDRKLLEILQSCYAAGGEYKVREISYDGVYVTNRADVKTYLKPDSKSEQTGGYPRRYTPVSVVGYTYNKWGNKWYCLDDGSYIYQNNITFIRRLYPSDYNNCRFCCCFDNASVRNGFDEDSETIGYLSFGQAVELKYMTRNLNGEYWFYIGSGWVFSENIAACNEYGQIVRRLRFDCPVDVELYDTNGKLAAKINHDGTVESSDRVKIVPYAVGDVKFFDIADDKEYRVRVQAYSFGNMEYEILGDYDEKSGTFKERRHFDNVTLEEGMKFNSTVGGDIKTDDIMLKVVDDAGNTIREIAPSEYVEEDELPPDNSGVDKSIYDKSAKNGGGKIWLIIVIIAVVVIATVIVIVMLLRRKKRRRLHRRESVDAGAPGTAVQVPQTQMIEYPQMNQVGQPEQQRQPASQQPIEHHQTVTQQRFKTRFCANCGSPLDSEQLYCGACGTKRLL